MKILFIACIFLISMPIFAQRTIEIGEVVADFRLKNIDGKMVSLSNYSRASKGCIVIFMSNHCPFSKVYEDRIIALESKFSPVGYAVFAINANDPLVYEEDSFENMKNRALEKNYAFPYLQDEAQVVARRLGATRTPQAFVLQKIGEKFVLQYSGAIDDNAQDANNITKHFIDEAVGNLLSGKPVITTVTKSVGCSIKWKNL